MEEADGKKLRRGPIRRPDFVPDWDRITWDSSIHEAGHSLMAMICGIGIREVFVPRVLDWREKKNPYTTMAQGYGWAPEAGALANAAGNGAEWSRGARYRKFSKTDGEGFADALGSTHRFLEFAAAAADVFRAPAIAAKLETLATFVYRRQGQTIDTTAFWGEAGITIENADRDAADSVLVRLGSPAGRYASQEERETRERLNAEMLARSAKWRETTERTGRPPR